MDLEDCGRGQAAFEVHTSRSDLTGLRTDGRFTLELVALRLSLYSNQVDLLHLPAFELGLEEEVKGLMDLGFGPELKSMQAIGYRHMVNYLEGAWSLEDCKDLLARDTRRYAKRQYTWFNKDQSINWFDRGDAGKIFSYVEQYRLDINSQSG